MNNHTTLLDPADRFAEIVHVLCQAVAARGRGERGGSLVVLLWQRLRRSAARFARLAAAWRNGAGPRRAVATATGRRARPARERKPTPRLLPNGQPDRLPDGVARDVGWLVRLAPDAAVCTGRLEHLLADPDVAAMVAASPPMARLLRPLCRMLAVTPALWPPRPPRPPGPAARETRPAPRRPAWPRPDTRTGRWWPARPRFRTRPPPW